MLNISYYYNLLNKGKILEVQKGIDKISNDSNEVIWLKNYYYLHVIDNKSIEKSINEIENRLGDDPIDYFLKLVYQLYLYSEKKEMERASKIFDKLKLIDINNINDLLESSDFFLYHLSNGVFLKKNKQIKKSMIFFSYLLKNMDRDNYYFLNGKLYNNYGGLNFTNKNFGDAIHNYLKSYSYFQKINSGYNLMILCNNIGTSYNSINDIHNATKYLKMATDYAINIGNVEIYSIIMFNISQIYWKNGELEEAKQCLELSKLYFDEKNDIETVNKIHLNLGIVFDLQGDISKAIEYYNICLKYYDSIGDDDQKSNCYNNLGISYQKLGLLNESRKYFLKSYDIKNKINIIDKVELLYNLYTVSYELKEDDLSVYYNELQKYPNTDLAKLVRAKECRKTNRYRDIIKAQNIYLTIIKSNNTKIEDKIVAILELIDILIEEFRNSKVIDIINEIIDLSDILDNIAQSQNSYWLRAKSFLLKSKIALLKLDTKEAKRLLSEAQKIAEDKNYHNLAFALSNEQDRLLDELQKIEKEIENRTDLISELGIKGFGEIIQQILYKKVSEEHNNQDKAILLLIINRSSVAVYSKRFSRSEVDEQLIAGFLTAINTMLSEVLLTSGSIERVKHKEYTLLFKPFKDHMFCYVLKGNSYYASQKLDQFILKITNDPKWDIFLDNSSKGRISGNDFIDGEVDKIFINKGD